MTNELNNAKMKNITMEKHTQEISEVKMNLDKEKTKGAKLEEYKNDKSRNMDEQNYKAY